MNPTASVFMSKNNFLAEHAESDSLYPLPNHLRRGLIVISIFAGLSFLTSLALFIYLNYKLISWRIRWRSRAREVVSNIPEPPPVPDFTLEDGVWVSQGPTSKEIHDRNVRQIRCTRNEAYPNQFLILIYNLFLADMHQATSFSLSAAWLARDGIFIDTSTCWIQGFFDSNGDLAASLFITLIAIHTYLAVVKGYQLPQFRLYVIIILVWLSVYSLSVVPLIATRNGSHVGGYFVRAGAWCWITVGYERLRLFTHYLFIFMSLFVTTVLYVAIFLSLRRQEKRGANLPGGAPSLIRHGHSKVFLIYPLIYVVCTLPLATGRIATMASAHVPITYYCFAGAMIAISGFCDCVLFGMTRQAIVFASKDRVSDRNTGLSTFTFMRTPASQYGNEVWISGGRPVSEAWEGVGGWWQIMGHRNPPRPATPPAPMRAESQQSLRHEDCHDMTIQMDVVTTVEVEVDHTRERNPRFPDPSSVESPSIMSHERYPSMKELD